MLDTVGWRDAFRIELRAVAIGLASRGWPVLPGSYPDQVGDAPEPVQSGWADRPAMHPQQVAEWWTTYPYSVLVATGTMLDAVEVDAELGRATATLLRACERPAPIVSMPNGRWLFLTAAGDEIPAELRAREGVRRHGGGSCVALPPTPLDHGVVHWRVKPEVWGWQLPHPSAMHGVLVRALRKLTGTAEEPAHTVETSAA
ncbi:Bifunctional DNA primase/polymerase, N-terminal [Haloechinothrix alba]|uniref:Bifunctional DNA primase/polymerase, N-terminal n=1 Tax=Haloechinothrix alba TaxID=664784 RepID=A0A238XVS1_9PSEU|nr:bifunctional DNA primase/polymerase [Haloechinothrix alba]SNR62631.1 Bifunctional DNA primase/polymerase, N-terminal [Haloechinothrix alba]